MFKSIAFVHYSTHNLDRALKFYRDALGLELLLQTEEWVEFKMGDQRLALRRIDASQPLTPAQPTGAMIWLKACPIETTVTYLKSININFIKGLTEFSYGKTSIIADPDGNAIGLYEPPAEE